MKEELALLLTGWFKKNARVLPWRSDPEPYAVWLSEIMLQQTQVATVLPYFDRFKKAFPTVKDLARAHIDQVYQLWAGLGYYSRARNLHKGANHIAILGRFPQDRDEWLLVPGVGDYTAGAICSIALQQREPIVDGNVVRVLSRIFAIQKLDAKKTKIWELASDLVQIKKVGSKKIAPDVLNQALMELGALVCKPKNPDCPNCPARAVCKGKKNPLLYPEPKPKKVWKRVQESKWILLHDGKVFLVQNEEKSWRHGLWDFPDSLESFLKNQKLRLLRNLNLKYVVTNHKVMREHKVFQVPKEAFLKTQSKGQWFEVANLPGVPAPVKKAIDQLVKNKEDSGQGRLPL